jgi:hypothetical protein
MPVPDRGWLPAGQYGRATVYETPDGEFRDRYGVHYIRSGPGFEIVPQKKRVGRQLFGIYDTHQEGERMESVGDVFGRHANAMRARAGDLHKLADQLVGLSKMADASGYGGKESAQLVDRMIKAYLREVDPTFIENAHR